MTTIKQWIDDLQLIAHPEGGYYRETIREDGKGRAAFSSIYFLLTADNISHFHRIDADEVWYYHAGDALTIHMITPSGDYETAQLGTSIKDGQVLQFKVPKGTIFASSIEGENQFSLVGCMCQPAFEFEQFELFDQQELMTLYPHLESIIKQYALEHKD